MGEKTQETLENSFLDYVCSNKMPLTIFLMNGVKLQGVVTQLADNVMVLSRDGHAQLVYKHSIATVMPNGSVELMAE